MPTFHNDDFYVVRAANIFVRINKKSKVRTAKVALIWHFMFRWF